MVKFNREKHNNFAFMKKKSLVGSTPELLHTGLGSLAGDFGSVRLGQVLPKLGRVINKGKNILNYEMTQLFYNFLTV